VPGEPTRGARWSQARALPSTLSRGDTSNVSHGRVNSISRRFSPGATRWGREITELIQRADVAARGHVAKFALWTWADDAHVNKKTAGRLKGLDRAVPGWISAIIGVGFVLLEYPERGRTGGSGA
jgi:hypothetical protein